MSQLFKWSDIVWSEILSNFVYIFIIWLVGRVIVNISKRAIEHMMEERQKSPLKFDPRRTKTIGKLIRNVISYTVNFFVILLILSQLGFDLTPLLAGAGVLGLAIGFGAQSLVKDVITGFFVIFEDQFGVGDVVQIGTYKGTVEEIGLRVTRIRSWTGEEYIIPNGTISQVTNFSIHNAIAVVDIPVAADQDIERITSIIKRTANQMAEQSSDIVKTPQVLGVQEFGQTEVVLRLTAECLPNKAAGVTRLLKAEVKKALEQAKESAREANSDGA